MTSNDTMKWKKYRLLKGNPSENYNINIAIATIIFLRLYVCVCFANKATRGSSPFLLMPNTLRNVTGMCGRGTEKGKKQRGVCDEASGMEQDPRFIRASRALPAGHPIGTGCGETLDPKGSSSAPTLGLPLWGKRT